MFCCCKVKDAKSCRRSRSSSLSDEGLAMKIFMPLMVPVVRESSSQVRTAQGERWPGFVDPRRSRLRLRPEVRNVSGF